MDNRQLDIFSHGHLLRWLTNRFGDDDDAWLDAYDAILTFIENDYEPIQSLLDRGWPRLLEMAEDAK